MRYINLALLLPLCLAAAPAPSPDQAAIEKQTREFHEAWQDNKPLERFFQDPDVLKNALAQSPSRSPLVTLLSRHRTVSRAEDGTPQVVLNSYWARRIDEQLPKGQERVEGLVTDEVFRYGPDLRITSYELRDRTAETRERFALRAKEHKAKLNNAALPKTERMGSGLKLFLDHWQIANTPELWPLLHQLIELGILDEPKGMEALRPLTERASRQLPVPEEHRPDVEKVLNWKPAPERPDGSGVGTAGAIPAHQALTGPSRGKGVTPDCGNVLHMRQVSF